MFYTHIETLARKTEEKLAIRPTLNDVGTGPKSGWSWA
jgi:hypothetical protein